jgi:hypothetical protein
MAHGEGGLALGLSSKACRGRERQQRRHCFQAMVVASAPGARHCVMVPDNKGVTKGSDATTYRHWRPTGGDAKSAKCAQPRTQAETTGRPQALAMPWAGHTGMATTCSDATAQQPNSGARCRARQRHTTVSENQSSTAGLLLVLGDKGRVRERHCERSMTGLCHFSDNTNKRTCIRVAC